MAVVSGRNEPDEIKLKCSETRFHNDGSELKNIFNSRLKLSNEFWGVIFQSNCPEGIVDYLFMSSNVIH